MAQSLSQSFETLGPMSESPPILLALALLAVVVLLAAALAFAALRRSSAWQPEAQQWFGRIVHGQESMERQLRDELQRLAQSQRAELSQGQALLLQQSGEFARLQSEKIEALRHQLAAAVGEMREQVEVRLRTLQEGNERKLEQMRQTVDEKLQATLEQRLGESFRQVAERLEQVHRGLGDMQELARDVGSLNRVLTNVKTRGIVGEVQLGALLEQVFTIEQYAANVEVVPGSGARVEYAIRLPQRGVDPASASGMHGGTSPTWLPIDAKFPREDYERLIEAQERSDAPGVEAAGKALEQRVRQEARTIREKYIAAPHTTDFGILFLPTEGLYAEVLRRPGLMQSLQADHRIILAGPTTLLAMLNSVQMGFRTLALERRSAEVWEVLGAVKTEFARFGDILAKTQKKLQEASNTIEQAAVRTRAMGRKLQEVQALPEHQSRELIGLQDLEEPPLGQGQALGQDSA